MKTIVIIGGGFAGSHAAKKLEKNKKFSVTLIDQKEYFEFTPSILKAINYPKHLEKIQIKHNQYLKNTNFILGKVDEISKDHVHLKNPLKKIPYDYLIISTGSSYVLPFKHHKALQINRGKDIQNHHKKLANTNKITIVGGGIVGVELAGEIADHYKDKKIELIQSNNSLIPRNCKTSQEYSKKILESKGIKIILNNKFDKSKYKIQKNHSIFICTGITPNFNFKLELNKNSLETNNFLQLKNSSNRFAIGDLSNIKEEKTAQNAIRQAKTAITNINRLEKNKSLKLYVSKKTPQIISIGKNKGIFEYKTFTIKGKIPIILKNYIEKKEMRKLRS